MSHLVRDGFLKTGSHLGEVMQGTCLLENGEKP